MIGNRLKDLRLKKGIEAQEMARILNVAKSTYSGYENNKSLPNYDLLSKISDYFNVTTDYLLGREHKKTPSNSSKKKDLDSELSDLLTKIDSDSDLLYKGKPLTEEVKNQLKGAIKMIDSIAKQKEN